MKVILAIVLSFISIINVNAKEIVEFHSCVDGDTFHVVINEKKQTIRMLAIDAPETVDPNRPVGYYGKEASEYLCNRVTNATKIEIEYEENANKIDHYGRILVWVFADGELLQKDIIEHGYAKVAYLYGDYKYAYILEDKQELAQKNKIGIWSNENPEIKEEPNNPNEEETTTSKYNFKEIIVIVVLIIIIIFSNNKKITKKANKQLKKYLK
jgi:micrococcal nuclease